MAAWIVRAEGIEDTEDNDQQHAGVVLDEARIIEVFDGADEVTTWDAIHWASQVNHVPHNAWIVEELHGFRQGRQNNGVHWGFTTGMGLPHLYMSQRMLGYLATRGAQGGG